MAGEKWAKKWKSVLVFFRYFLHPLLEKLDGGMPLDVHPPLFTPLSTYHPKVFSTEAAV